VETEDLRQKYRQALASFLAKAEQDPYILGVVLLGSLSYAVVWERSDIDLHIITQDIKLRVKSYSLVEDEINVHASVGTRAEFKQLLEGAIGSSFMHSVMTRGTLVYCRDETLTELFEARHKLGARDREISMLRATGGILWALDKALKWLIAKDDYDYSFVWALKCLDPLATLVVIRSGEVPDREAIPHALRLDPGLIRPLYTGLIHDARDPATLAAALQMIESYILDNAHELCAPVFDYLQQAGAVRSASEIDEHFNRNFGVGAALLCEWFADRGLIDKVSSPVRLTEKSRVDFGEAAFYYDGE
jgi:hypothetical protein